MKGSDSVESIAAAAFWAALPDHEFFGPAVQHVYFYSDVDDDTVGGLRDAVLAASRATAEDDKGVRVNPLPIVVHVHSRGGSMWAENWLLSLFNQVAVPLCVMVDGVSASAATSLSVMAPYRVGTPYSLSLLHDYAGASFGKRESLLADVADTERHRELYKQLYLARSRLSDAQLEELLRHDRWLDAETCLKLGIYDRIVRPDRSAAARRYLAGDARMAGLSPSRAPFMKTNYNVVYSGCDAALVAHFDAILAAPAKPVVFVTPGTDSCEDERVALTLIARIRASPVPVFGVVDNRVGWWRMLPVLFCHRRFMYENAVLESDLVYTGAWGARLQDIVHNATTERGLITRAVKERGKPGAGLLADMFDRRLFITAQECKAHGLIDEVVPLAARRQAPLAARGRRASRRGK